jgi:2-amino-4-hydroxy-6-hydroxymethyldihydropteridine diphosphokinase
VDTPDGRPFLNMVARSRSDARPLDLLDLLHQVERRAGRVRRVPNRPRTLDLDLLLLGDRRVDTPRLQVPHPRLAERPFVLEPLRDLAPDRVHPTLRRSIDELAAAVRDPAAVRRRDA